MEEERQKSSRYKHVILLVIAIGIIAGILLIAIAFGTLFVFETKNIFYFLLGVAFLVVVFPFVISSIIFGTVNFYKQCPRRQYGLNYFRPFK